MENMESMQGGTSSAVKERIQFKAPPKCRVWLLNDDYTTMEFVVFVLKSVFHHSEETATLIMQAVHKNGKGVAGIYSCDIANTKARQVEEFARSEGFPLRCEVEYLK